MGWGGTPSRALGDPQRRKRRFTHAEFFKGLDMQQSYMF